MLRMDVDQPFAQSAELLQLYGQVVDEGAALAGRGDDAREGRLGGVVEVVLLEEGLQREPREVERSLHAAVACGVFRGGAVVLGAEQQREGAEQDRLSGTRFARDDVQLRIELQAQAVDERIVFNRKTT